MDCIFCKIVNGDIPSYKIYEDDLVYVFLDIKPTMPGHMLIIPKEHTLDMCTIDNNVLIHVFEVARDMRKLCEEKLGCNGVTFAQNNGAVQEVKHFHLHVVPHYENKPDWSIEEVYKKIS